MRFEFVMIQLGSQEERSTVVGYDAGRKIDCGLEWVRLDAGKY
jgi:hypothetical protein